MGVLKVWDGTQWVESGGATGTDNDAIHDNVSSELSAVAEKLSVIASDIFLIEDSAATNAKKKVLLSTIETFLNHNALLGYIANQHRTVLSVRKTSDETKNSDNSLADDNTLVITPTINTDYILTAVIFFDSDTTPDYRYEFGGPSSGATIKLGAHGGSDGGDTSRYFDTTTGFNELTQLAIADTNTIIHFIQGIVTIGSTAGDIAYRWSQRIVDAAGTTVQAGSWMRLETIT